MCWRGTEFQPRTLPYSMFRFTIRDLLWLMVVVALSIMLWRERDQNSKTEARIESRLTAIETQLQSIVNSLPAPPPENPPRPKPGGMF